MGYTHYFRQLEKVNPETWAKITADVQTLCDNSPVTLCNGSGDIGSHPKIDAESIAFNGEDNENDDSHETFCIAPWYEDFNFCKTAYKPYDLIVTASLAVANHHAPTAWDIGSDGGSDGFNEGLDFARTTLNNPTIGNPYRNED